MFGPRNENKKSRQKMCTGCQVHHPIILGLGGETSEKLGSWAQKMFLKYKKWISSICSFKKLQTFSYLIIKFLFCKCIIFFGFFLFNTNKKYS